MLIRRLFHASAAAGHWLRKTGRWQIQIVPGDWQTDRPTDPEPHQASPALDSWVAPIERAGMA